MPKRAKRKRGSEKWREMKREREAERERELVNVRLNIK